VKVEKNQKNAKLTFLKTKIFFMIIEICCTSKTSLSNAINGGASRLEICENLLEDGLTPSSKFLKDVIDQTTIPAHVLIRPRSGNFFYSKQEVKKIEDQIEMAKSLGAHGIVMGALNQDYSLALSTLKNWVKMAHPLDLTFHRAFDRICQPRESLKRIIDLGFDRVLTSGQQSTAIEGLDLLVDLQKIAKEQIVIMPGGGINNQNCELFFKAGFHEIHLSAKGRRKTEDGEPISDLKMIKKVVTSASKLGLNAKGLLIDSFSN